MWASHSTLIYTSELILRSTICFHSATRHNTWFVCSLWSGLFWLEIKIIAPLYARVTKQLLDEFFCDVQSNQGRDNKKPNLIIVLLYIEPKKLEVMFLLLYWREATQGARTWHDYPWPWVSLRWLKTVFSTFQDLDFDASL